MRWFLIFLLSAVVASAQTTSYTEFYCNLTGTNVNSGTTTNAAATYTSVNGNWDGTSVFTPTDGSTPASSVNVGDFASVCLDAATAAVFIARVVTVAAGVNGAITVSTVAATGTAPATGATGRSIRVGGAWRGSFGSVTFPYTFLGANVTNLSANVVRINVQSGYSNTPSSAISFSTAGPMVIQGYTVTAGDGGRGIIDAGGNNITIATINGNGVNVADMIFQNNAAGNNVNGLTLGGKSVVILRCVARYIGGSGFLNNGNVLYSECEAYSCGLANVTGTGGFKNGGTVTYLRCLSHNNSTTKGNGFSLTATATLINSLAISNGAAGCLLSSASDMIMMIGCEAYGNSGSGLELGNASPQGVYAENSNFIKNLTNGIASYTNQLRIGYILNCGFGSGTMTNTQGNLSSNMGTTNSVFLGSLVTYPTDVNPYVNAGANNFSISSSSAAHGTGLGVFLDLLNSGGTVSYPNIGASVLTNAASSGGSWTFAQ